jgi:beta-phosphoglucomutase-like phosphatase (HAD superfamily)
MMTRALIFDVDGTIVDSMPAHARSWDVFRRRHGLDISVEEILRRTTGLTGVECIRELMGQQISDEAALALIGEKEADYRHIFAADFREVAGFSAFVARAQALGLKFAVASAGDRNNLAFVWDRLGLQRQPEVEIRGDMGLPGKPAPDMFLEAARRLGVSPAECIVFEDAPFGIEAAARAGMRAVAICSTHTPAELAGAHVLSHVRNFEELMSAGFLDRLDMAS